MAEFLDPSQLSLSLSENRDSTDTSVVMEDDEGEAEEFYEKIEAPKFVDFTVPNHYCPDDRYWFCLRVGCDQQHEKEMDSETIYKNFVLRVMAARSPNVRLRKALNKSASSSKCPQSAPPKSSKSRLAFVSSNSQKIIEDKKKVVRPLLKPVSTPTTTKTKPVAAKYLTTPRNRNGLPKQNSFRSVRNPKSTAIEVPKNRMAAKALIFHSPKKFIKVKTSVELRTPLTKLRERTKRVEITSQRKQVLLHSSKSSKNSQIQEAKSVRSIKSKCKVQLSKPPTSKELEGNGCSNMDVNAKSRSCTTLDISRIQNINNDKQHTMDSAVSALFEQQKSTTDTCLSSAAPPLTKILDSALSDNSGGEANRLLTAEENNSNLQAPNGEENSNNRHEQFITGTELTENDDKENAAASDQNRAHDHNHNHNQKKMKGKFLGFQDAHGKVHHKLTQIAQAKDKSSGTVDPVTKFKKPKPTTPKPFRLRTDERRILKEANLERKNNILPQNESAVSTTLGTNLHRKQGNDQKVRFKTAATMTPQRPNLLKHREPKPRTSPIEGKTIQSLKNFRKIKSSLRKQQVQHQGLTSTRKMISYSTTSRPLEVIYETSEHKKGRNMTANGLGTTGTASGASRSSSRGRRPVNIAKEPNINSLQVQTNCGRNRILRGL
ncbi:Hypothetical predicted protein [Olea europaea subsp. europaea]|uniref:Uncharacterized protein n=1 Tax=Olea europaea subsp. europaea TaxID=158383 RepID=A0A8S0QWE1_OLEEU|nr:Hypothetical predicted protein [Olea europaea subsp. europaea]